MNSKVQWSEQVSKYVLSKAPDPRRELIQAIKALDQWDGREHPPRLRHLEDKLAGYSRLRVREHRIIFRDGFVDGKRTLLCLYAGPRKTVYEAFEEIMLDDLTGSEHTSGHTPA